MNLSDTNYHNGETTNATFSKLFISVIQVREDLTEPILDFARQFIALDVAGLPTAVLSFENVLTFCHNNPPVGCSSSRNLLYFT